MTLRELITNHIIHIMDSRGGFILQNNIFHLSDRNDKADIIKKDVLKYLSEHNTVDNNVLCVYIII